MNNEKPLLFLNVDGVLTSSRTYYGNERRAEDRLDPVALWLLQNFCERMNAEVSMATFWPMYQSPKAWRDAFERKGATIPVIGMLERPGRADHDWAGAMDDYMALFPNRPYVLFDDDPIDPDHPRLVHVDRRVGLTVENLLSAALLIAPDSKEAKELQARCRGGETVTIGVGGKSLSVHPRDIGKALEQLGIVPASIAE